MVRRLRDSAWSCAGVGAVVRRLRDSAGSCVDACAVVRTGASVVRLVEACGVAREVKEGVGGGGLRMERFSRFS